VGGASSELVGAHREERVVGEKRVSVGDDAVGDVTGAVRAGTDGDLTETVSGKVSISVVDAAQTEPEQGTLEGTSSLKLVVGDKVVLAMTSGGDVQLVGTNLTLDGSGIKAKGGKLQKIQPAGVQNASAGASLQPGEVAWIDIVLADGDGAPVPQEPFRVEFPDGTVKEGRLDREGKARVWGPKGGKCKVTFPRFDGSSWRLK
jgi:hypothetical protein